MMAGENQKMCASCAAWHPPEPGGTMGQCRLNPPVPFMAMATTQQSRLSVPDPRQQQQAVQPIFPSAWPISPADGWCRQWSKEGE